MQVPSPSNENLSSLRSAEQGPWEGLEEGRTRWSLIRTASGREGKQVQLNRHEGLTQAGGAQASRSRGLHVPGDRGQCVPRGLPPASSHPEADLSVPSELGESQGWQAWGDLYHRILTILPGTF